MSWSYEIDSDSGVVVVTYAGEVTANELQESTSKLIEMQKELDVDRFLIDTHSMLLEGVSLLDLYKLPTEQYLLEEANPLARVAILPPQSESAREAVRFYETACVNRGWPVKVFAERGAAIDWLTS